MVLELLLLKLDTRVGVHKGLVIRSITFERSATPVRRSRLLASAVKLAKDVS